jgi:hypothetical protein
MKHEYTSDEVASFAGLGLNLGKDWVTDAQFRSVCGSVRTQARPWTLVPLLAHHEFSGEEVATFASLGARLGKDALTDEQFRAVCGSALTQVRPHEPPPPRNALMEYMFWASRPPTMAEFLRRG